MTDGQGLPHWLKEQRNRYAQTVSEAATDAGIYGRRGRTCAEWWASWEEGRSVPEAADQQSILSWAQYRIGPGDLKRIIQGVFGGPSDVEIDDAIWYAMGPRCKGRSSRSGRQVIEIVSRKMGVSRLRVKRRL